MGADGGEVAQVLLELGIPLDVVPLDEQGRFADVDVDSRQLLGELQVRHARLLQAGNFGQAQQLSEHVQYLASVGAELRQLQVDSARLSAAVGPGKGAELAVPIRELEANRLNIAALYETDFWLEQMSRMPSESQK